MTRDELLDLFPVHRSKLVSGLARLVGNDEAEDLAAETLLRAMNAIEDFREESALGTWLYRIGINLAYDLLRQRNRHSVSSLELERALDGEFSGTLFSAEENVRFEQRQMSECVRALMAKLPPEQRHVLTQAEMLDQTAQEIARDVCISTGNAKIRLHRARRTMKKVLETHCEFEHGETGVRCCVPKAGG